MSRIKLQIISKSHPIRNSHIRSALRNFSGSIIRDYFSKSHIKLRIRELRMVFRELYSITNYFKMSHPIRNSRIRSALRNFSGSIIRNYFSKSHPIHTSHFRPDKSGFRKAQPSYFILPPR